MIIPRLLGGSELRIRGRPKEEKILPSTDAGVRARGGQKTFRPGGGVIVERPRGFSFFFWGGRSEREFCEEIDFWRERFAE